MKIVVIGGGVVGMLSAYYLSKISGLSVSIVEKGPELGQEASAANANHLSYTAYVFPAISPDLLWKIPKILTGRDPIMKCESLSDWRFWLWGLQALPLMLSQKKYKAVSDRLLEINQSSEALMDAFVSEHAIDFSYQKSGRLSVYDKAEALDHVYAAYLERGLSEHVQRLTYDETLALEPGLAKREEAFAGSLYLPSDYIGNCEHFTKGLRTILERQGVEILTGMDVVSLRRENGEIVSVQTLDDEIAADLFVMAAGSWSAPLLCTAGIHLPVYPAQGYTYEIFPETMPFRTGVVDVASKMVFTPFEKSLKISAGVFFRPIDGRENHEAFLKSMRETARTLYPEVDFTGARLYSGYRPWSADCLPRVEQSSCSNLFLNTGHGMTGWTMAHGTSHALADIVARQLRN